MQQQVVNVIGDSFERAWQTALTAIQVSDQKDT